MLSAYTGVASVYAQALGAHRSASGSGSATATADPGSIAVNAGALGYGVTMSNSLVGLDPPAGFTNIITMSDASIKGDGEYAVSANAGSTDPQWTWHFTPSSPGTWLATVLALNPEPPIALDQWNGTFNERGTQIIKGFNYTNAHVGDAIVATFFWLGSTNIIDSVTDVLTTNPYSPVGNTYRLVEYVTSGGVSMATYVAVNVQHFPDAYRDSSQDSILAVRANLSQSVTDAGIMMTAYTGVSSVYAQALGAHRSALGSGSSTTTADPGAIAVNAGALAYGVTMSNGHVGMDLPAGWTNIVTQSDDSIKGDGDYLVSANGGSVDPQWTWYFDAQPPGTWLASVLSLNRP